MTKKLNISFKTDKPTGRYSSFFSSSHYIKLNKKQIGQIEDKSPHRIRLMVFKKDINEDGNSNCSWKWITLKQLFDNIEQAKDYIRNRIVTISLQFNLRQED